MICSLGSLVIPMFVGNFKFLNYCFWFLPTANKEFHVILLSGSLNKFDARLFFPLLYGTENSWTLPHTICAQKIIITVKHKVVNYSNYLMTK